MRDFSGKKNSQYGKRGNVMTPLNWMAVISEMVILPSASVNAHNWLGKGLFILACIIVLYYGVMYLYYSIKDPNRLQTEQYNLESQQMLFHHAKSEGITSVDSTPKITSTNIDSKN